MVVQQGERQPPRIIKLLGKKMENAGGEVLSSYCMPLLFQENPHHTPQVGATATLINHSNERYLVTAAHVYDKNIKECGLPYVATTGKKLKQFSQFQCVRSNDTEEFSPDILYSHLKSEADSLAEFLEWLKVEKDSDSGDFDYFYAIGFAASRNKRPKLVPRGGILKNPSATYLRCAKHPTGDRILERLGYDASNHLVISYKRRSMKKSGQRVMGPNPIGMSGGPLFGVRESASGIESRFCGILTEYLENDSAIIATRASFVRANLRPYRQDA